MDPLSWSTDDHNKVLEILMNCLSNIKCLVTTENPEKIINCFQRDVKPLIDILLCKNNSSHDGSKRCYERLPSLNYGQNDLENIRFTLMNLLSKVCHYDGSSEIFRNACLMSVELLKLFGKELLQQLLNFSTASINKINLDELKENKNSDSKNWEDVEDKLCLEHSIELLSHLIGYQNDWNFNDNIDESYNMIVTFLLEVLDVVDNRLVIRILLEVVPKMKNWLSERDVLIYVWDNVKKISQTNADNDDSDLRIWTLLGCVADTLFSDNCLMKSDASLELVPMWMNQWFWKFIQRGLMHSVELQRRRALYMIKRGINWLENSKESFDYGLIDDKENIIFSWSSQSASQILKYFSDVILILETLEEKQAHVIKPLCSIIVNLIEATTVTNGQSYVLHHSWIAIIIHRLLQHDTRSVRKWTLETICDLNFEKLPLFKDGTEEVILKSFLEALNDTALFSTGHLKDYDDEEFIANKMVNLWNSCCVVHSTDGLRFRRILTIINSISWGAVPIMYIFRSMSQISPCQQWTCEDIGTLRQLLEHSLTSHDVFLRSATQCFIIETFLKLAKSEQLSFSDLSTFFGIMNMDECLKRGTHLWNSIVSWLKDILFNKPTSKMNKDLAVNFIFENTQDLFKIETAALLVEYTQYDTRRSLHLVRMLVILFDCGVLNASDSDQHSSLNQISLSPLLTLSTCFSRPYIVLGVIEGSLEFFLQLIYQTDFVGTAQDELSGWLSNKIESILVDFLPFLKLKLNEVSYEDSSCLECYLNFLNNIVDLHGSNIVVHDFIIDLCAIQINCLKTEQSPSRIKQFVAAKCFYLLYILLSRFNIRREGKLLAEEFSEVCLDRDFLITVAPNANTLSFAKMTHSMNSNQLSSLYLSTLWTCMSMHLQMFYATKCDAVLNHTYSALDIGGTLCIKPVFSCLENLLPRVVNDKSDLVLEVIENSWKMIDNMKLNVDYWMALESFVNVAYQVSLLENEQISPLLYEYAKMISELSESTHRIVLHLFEKTSKSWMNATNLDCLTKNVDLLILFLTFGFLHLKDVRILNQAVSYIVQLGKVCATNDLMKSNHTTGAEIRSQAIVLLLSSTQKEGSSILLQQLLLSLVEYDKKILTEKSRLFANSRVHRLQHRIWQCLLLLEPYLTKESIENLIEISFQKLVEDSLQPSVRFYVEWILTKILYDHPEKIPEFWEMLQKDTRHRFGSLTSIFSIMFNLGTVLKGNDQLSFLEKSLKTILPWCTAQHYNTRVYAQIVLRRMWEFCKSGQLIEIVEKLGLIESIMTTSIQSKLGGMGASKLLYDDFKFQVFNPVIHYTFEAVFYEIPRIFQVTDEEWIEPGFFEKAYNSNYNFGISFRNEINPLSSCEPRKWVELIDDNVATNDLKDVQKKIIPWKTVFPDLEALKDSSTLKRKEHENSKLILMASLIDRTPNLGGLCRTCEIFGVAEYVIGNLKYIEDKQFQTLSVSAERWVSIKEVKPSQMKDYIIEMKADGYTIVGAEQTANSTKLTNYKFPKKTVIVLGNEKEGIPVDIIQLLDVSAEIPQQGIIRSLNVHVSGAILIWEYFKQQMTSGT